MELKECKEFLQTLEPEDSINIYLKGSGEMLAWEVVESLDTERQALIIRNLVERYPVYLRDIKELRFGMHGGQKCKDCGQYKKYVLLSNGLCSKCEYRRVHPQTRPRIDWTAWRPRVMDTE